MKLLYCTCLSKVYHHQAARHSDGEHAGNAAAGDAGNALQHPGTARPEGDGNIYIFSYNFYIIFFSEFRLMCQLFWRNWT